MRIAIGSDQAEWLHKEYINCTQATVVKNKQVEFGAAITKNKYCEIKTAIAWSPDISFYAISIPAL